MDEESLLMGCMIGVSIMFIFGLVCLLAQVNSTTQLGKAICLERYNAEYVNYAGGILKCKNNTQEKYDGITVQIGDK